MSDYAKFKRFVDANEQHLARYLRERRTDNGGYDYFADLYLGHKNENRIAALLGGDTSIEIKSQINSCNYGHVTLDYNDDEKLERGLGSSEAEWYCYSFDGNGYNGEVVVLIKTGRLRKLAEKFSWTRRNKSGKIFGLMEMTSLLEKL